MKFPEYGICLYHCNVGPDWLDYNEHMNVAYYLKAFDDASEVLAAAAGMGVEYTRNTGLSWVALESHITFQQEALLGDALRVESRVLAVDGKKLHYYQEMFRSTELLATHEQLGLAFDTGARKSVAFSAEIHAGLEALRVAADVRPCPDWVGRAISLTRSKPTAPASSG